MRVTNWTLYVMLCGCLAAPAAATAGDQHSAPVKVVHATPPSPTASHPAPVPVPQKIAANPALLSRVQALLPSGMTVATAASGFKNSGQFIAALHVSRNLGIPFAQLKAEMTGTDHDSLGQAIHDLKPAVGVKPAVKTAREQTHTDIKATTPPNAEAHEDKDGK